MFYSLGGGGKQLCTKATLWLIFSDQCKADLFPGDPDVCACLHNLTALQALSISFLCQLPLLRANNEGFIVINLSDLALEMIA